MANPNDKNPNTTPITLRRITDLKKKRIGYFEQVDGIPMTPETAAAVRLVASELSRQEFEVVPFRSELLGKVRELWWSLFGEAGAYLLNPMFAGRHDDVSPILREFLAQVAGGHAFTLERFMSVLLDRDAVRMQFLNGMADIPLLLCPVCAIPAFKHRDREWDIEGRTMKYLDTASDVMAYTQWFNLLGNPAAVVPVSRSAEGLPIGVQIVGRPWEEGSVLALAQVVEAIADRPVLESELEKPK